MIRFIRRILYRFDRKRGKFQQVGKNSEIGRPRLLEGASHISIGSRCVVREGAWLGVFPNHPAALVSPPSLTIEDDVYLGFYACLTVIGRMIIKRGTVISDYFYASDHTHSFDPRRGSCRQQPLSSKGPVVIEIGRAHV